MPIFKSFFREQNNVPRRREGSPSQASGTTGPSWTTWFCGAALAVSTLFLGLSSRESQAKLEPYYIVSGVSYGQVNPRILFVLDTSGSMAWKANTSEQICSLKTCETGTDTQKSRIAIARNAIRTVVDATKDRADFALMTFGQERPPTAKGHIPSKCGSGASATRFSLSNYYYDPVYGNWDYSNLHGFNGVWRLCGDNKPYPYLRWDNLGRGSVITADDQTGAIPSSPLISKTSANFKHSDNAKRLVQWFPDFLGVRVNLNATTDPDKAYLYGTYGDYGSTNAERDAGVWGRDFYYWPYVDGFPGYSFFADWDTGNPLGFAWSSSSSGGSLYAPFYLGVSPDETNPNAIGPLSREASLQKVLDLTAPMTQGGVDTEGGTPWSSTIGPITGAPPKNNAVFSHSTVASYLSFMKNWSEDEVCVPLVAILITDGNPSPSTEGGSKLHGRLAALRTDLGVKVYVIGFVVTSGPLNDMACAGAGSNNTTTPCNGTPTEAWDTCANPAKPKTECAYVAADAGELGSIVTDIVHNALTMEIASGPGFSVNEFGVGARGEYGAGDKVQTEVAATTDWPEWKGNVIRSLCTDVDPVDGDGLAAYCIDNELASDGDERFGPCPAGREWNAGSCLALTDWSDRRIYTNDSDNKTFRITDDSGKATAAFRDQLNAADLAIPGAPFDSSTADLIAAFILGKGWKDEWKLPGLAQSAPIVVRRIPNKSTKWTPSVGIRDPHCSGRELSANVTIPTSLEDFASAAWSEKNRLTSPSSHYEYQEAVMIGDDLGMLHAFQLDSGNELWGFIPRFALKSAVKAYAYGGANYGQPEEMDDHVYGMGGTLNNTWVFDDTDEDDKKWRHVAIIGQAAGGNHLVALDVSHMSPSSPKGPIEILWTTDDPDLRDEYSEGLGETWARPAITYHVPNDTLDKEPKAYLVFGSGYPSTPATSARQGRTIYMADVITGNVVSSAELPAAVSAYDSNFGTVVDPVITTHCVSRYWAEAQETYFVDQSGRLFRWDLGRETDHAADSGGKWGDTAKALFTFKACKSTADTGCTIAAGNNGDPFFFSPAIVTADRIDSTAATPGTFDESKRNRALIAMASGALNDSVTDAGLEGADLHSSLYLLVDDHRAALDAGLSIPGIGDRADIGVSNTYYRMAITDFERTRVYRPFEDAPEYTDTRKFSRRTRPIRSPRIAVSGAVDGSGNIIEGVEVYDIEYTVFEPPSNECSSKWYDKTEEKWYFDEGSTYVIQMRLTVKDDDSFSFGSSRGGLEFTGVEQVREGACEDGVCSPMPGTASSKPCDPNTSAPSSGGEVSVSLGYRELSGFSPVELNVDD
jgi:hypothetical protein